MIKLFEGSLSAVNSSELLRLRLQAQAEAQHEWYTKSETQGNFFGVWFCGINGSLTGLPDFFYFFAT